MNTTIRPILLGALLFYGAIPLPIQAYEGEKPEKMNDGTQIIYSPTAPKWVPPQLDTFLPNWVDLEASWISQPIFNATGGSQQTAAYADQWGFNLTLSRGINKKESEKREFDHWSLHGNFSLQLGNPAYSTDISSIFAPQSIYSPQGFWLRGFYIERESDAMNLKFGPSMTMNDLVDSPAYAYYTNAIINGVLNLQVPGLAFDPYNSWGASIDLKLTKQLSLKYGLFQLSSLRGQNTDSANDYLGWNLSTSKADGLVQAIKIDYAYRPQGDALKVCLDKIKSGIYLRSNANCKQPGAIENNLPKPIIQLGGYTAGWQFPYLDGSGQMGSRINGIFIHGTTVPFRFPLGHGTSLWASAVLSSNEEINQVPFSIMGGFISQGVLPARPFDQLVFGLARSSLSAHSNYNGTSQVYSAMAELDYAIKLNDRFSIEPGLQFIFNPSGNSNYATIVAPTLQLTFSF